MFLDRLQASRAWAALGCVAAGCMVVVPSAAQQAAAPATPAPEMTPAERAQRDASNVYKWILIHADKPRKPGAARIEEKRDEKPVATSRAKPAGRIADVAPAGAAPSPVVEASVASARAPETAAPTAVRVADTFVPKTSPSTETPEARAAFETRAMAVVASPQPPLAVEALDEVLTPVFRADPEFPSHLLRTLRKGQVRVSFTVMSDGSVAEPRVVTSSNAKLNVAALAAVAQWRFAQLRKPQPGVVDLGFDLD